VFGAEPPAVVVKDIHLVRGSDGSKRIFIEFDRYYTPILASFLKGEEPEVRVTIGNGKMSPGVPSAIEVSGQSLRRIRTAREKTNGGMCIILDLQPRTDCQINYVHYLGKNLFCIDIAGAKPSSRGKEDR